MKWTESTMKVFGFLKKSSSAPIARERLQILLAHERRGADQPELLNLLREEILAVIAKHLQFDREKVVARFIHVLCKLTESELARPVARVVELARWCHRQCNRVLRKRKFANM